MEAEDPPGLRVVLLLALDLDWVETALYLLLLVLVGHLVPVWVVVLDRVLLVGERRVPAGDRKGCRLLDGRPTAVTAGGWAL